MAAVTDMIAWPNESLNEVQVFNVYEHISQQLPLRNGIATEYNDIITTTTGSSINCVLLGNTVQSTPAFMYIGEFYYVYWFNQCMLCYILINFP